MITQNKFIKTLKGRRTCTEAESAYVRETKGYEFSKYIEMMAREHGSLKAAGPNIVLDYIKNNLSLSSCTLGEIVEINDNSIGADVFREDIRRTVEDCYLILPTSWQTKEKKYDGSHVPEIIRNYFDYSVRGFNPAKLFKKGNLLLLNHSKSSNKKYLNGPRKDGINLSTGKLLLDRF